MKKRPVVALAGALLLSMSATAHHSAAQFDFTKTVTVEGTVKVFDVLNPHTRVILEVTDAKGTRDIEFEGHSRNNVYRRGWRPDSVKIGDRITIGIAPMRNGEDGGYVTSVKPVSGKDF